MLKNLMLFCFLCILVFSSTTCSKKTTEPIDQPLEPIVNEHVVVIDPAQIPFFEFMEDHIIFPSIPGIPIPSLNVNVVLVCPPCTAAPNGFLRRITAKTKYSDRTVVDTEDAALDDVFDQASIDEDADLETTKIKSTQYYVDGIQLIPDAKDATKFTYNLNCTFTKMGVDFNVQGPITFTNKMKFSTRIEWIKKIDKIKFEVKSVQTANLVCSASRSLPQSSEPVWDSTLVKHEMTPITFWIGVVPIVIVPVLSLDAYITATGQICVSVNVSQKQTVNSGISYDRDRSPKWKSYYTRDPETPTITGPDLTFNGDFELGVGPTLTGYLYGIVGPSAGVKGLLNLVVDSEAIPWWRLDLGAKLEFAIDLKKISKNLQNPSFEIESPKVTILQAPTNECITPEYSPLGGTYYNLQNVSLSCNTSGAKIRYTLDGSTPTSSSSEYYYPIPISSETTLKAKAFKSGYIDSRTIAAHYNIVSMDVSNPVMNPPGGRYVNPVSVTMTCPTIGATIRYTTDGSTPNQNSPAYSSAIHLTDITTIKAKAFKSGMNDSDTVTNSYVIGSMSSNFISVAGGVYNNGMSAIPNVTVGGFRIDKYELTQRKYEAVMGTNPSFSKRQDNPVENITWFDAVEFCNKLSILEGVTPCYSYLSYGTNPLSWPTGWNSTDANHTNINCNWQANGYRLPTEAEWHFAARGNAENLYSGSNDINSVAWYLLNSGFPPSTQTVGTKQANGYSLFDMSGNVWEWVWDIYDKYPTTLMAYYPTGATSGNYRVLRGASIVCHAGYFPLLHRNYLGATYKFMDVGVRICTKQ